MDVEGISSLAVVDNQQNVIGNISTVDVKVSVGRPPTSILSDNLMAHSFSRSPAQLHSSITPVPISSPSSFLRGV